MQYLFLLFFSSPVLSPSFGNNSLYLYIILPLFDMKFLTFLISKKKTSLFFYVLFLLMLSLILFHGDVKIFIKLVVFFCITNYLYYLFLRKKLYILFYFIIFNIIIANIQFFSYLLLDYKILDPVDISTFLYGKFAMHHGNTFDLENYLLPLRVSGLSKEPGFFSSLLIASYSMFWLKYRTFFSYNKTRLMHLLFLEGLLLSFSKITIVYILAVILYFVYKKILSKLPSPIFIILYITGITASVIFLFYRNNNIPQRKTIIHRTIGYYIVYEFYKLDIADVVLGIGAKNIINYEKKFKIIKYSPYYFKKTPNLILDNSGLATIIIYYGIVGFSLLLLLCYLFNLKSEILLLFLLSTINVSLTTVSSFIIIWFFIIIITRQNGCKVRLGKTI